MPDGPNRAPGRYDVPVSKGAPLLGGGKSGTAIKRSIPQRGTQTDESDIVCYVLVVKARLIGEPAKGGDAREDRVGLQPQFSIMALLFGRPIQG